ncbi:hypothetical protein FSP39_014270 [Pinctada imbricata]|uniref:B box-type domain-containing protein n=1 Tax=Pinctada imbricata TaxID=66713 RepID=A0AA88YTJ1_PINIB|nr:hypothetical protein FSP39_014270 [Pinctada imbricata]
MAFASSNLGAQEAIIKPCDLCEDDEYVNWFCKDCNQNLCDRCKMTHLRSNVSKSHVVLSISEGFVMGKRNLSNFCREHDELFTFFCRTCDKNICAKCLSTKHKKHDFVDSKEFQKQMNDVIEEKQRMTRNYDDFVQSEEKSDTHLKDQCTNTDERLEAIELGADEEGEKSKESLCSIIQQQEEAKESKKIIQTQTGLRLCDDDIHTDQQELPIQTTSSLNDFVKDSITKLKSLKPISIAIPDEQQVPCEEQRHENQIMETIGNQHGDKITEITEGEGKDGSECNGSSKLEISRTLNLNRFKSCCSMWLSPDGSIWIGGDGYVYKMSSDCSRVLHQITTRNSYGCGYIACLQSGDAVVSYGGVPYVDILASDGRRVDFTDLSPKSIYDIAVNNQDEIAINVAGKSIAIFTNDVQQLKEFNVGFGIETFCTDRDGHFIVAHPGSPYLTILDGRNGAVKTSWKVSISDIERLTCDRHGNLIASNNEKNVYFFSRNGEVQKTFTVDCDEIIGICVNEGDNLWILVCTNDEYKMHITTYLKE